MFLLFSCTPQTKRGTGAVASAERHYSMPDVPSSLKEPAERARFVVAHYWERYDFDDTAVAQDSVYVEQAFVDYAAVLPLAGEEKASASIGQLLQRTEKTEYRERLMELAKHYLGHPESPMRNEEMYVLFLNKYASLSSVPMEKRERARYMAGQLLKNRVGTMAADFTYTDRKGNRNSLYRTESELTLLFFYDPDCENCHRIFTHLRGTNLLFGKSKLKVLTIYGDNDTARWKESRQPIPEGWTDVQSPEIAAKQLYYIPATPSMYLLDKNKRVILKDPQPELLHKTLEELLANEE